MVSLCLDWLGVTSLIAILISGHQLAGREPADWSDDKIAHKIKTRREKRGCEELYSQTKKEKHK